MRHLDGAELAEVIMRHAYPVAFATVSGAHLYGFPSRNSDVDLRGVHLLPLAEVVGLVRGPETITRTWMDNDAEIDLVTHDLAKYLRMMVGPDGYVLEQVLSPLVVSGGPLHEELIALAARCVTSGHAHHYRGFARSQRAFWERGGDIKHLLYAFRVLMTGIHLMRSGEVVAHLPTLGHLVPEAPEYLSQLVTVKSQSEHGEVPESVVTADVVAADLDDLSTVLDGAEATSALPDECSAGPAAHDLLLRTRLGRDGLEPGRS
jgi:predicted nucleotidyltransferase